MNKDKYNMDNVKRYEHIDLNDPNRQAKLKAQRDEFEKDAKEGKVLCLSDLMISHGM
jgi:hypothetical protein